MTTAEKFDKKYPNGLIKGIADFEKTLYEIMTTDEIDKIIKCADSRKNEKELKQFKKEYLKAIEPYKDNEDAWLVIPIWGILPFAPRGVLSDVIARIIMKDKTTLTGKDLFGEDTKDE